ncbi:MAG: hypothetical protein FWH26_10000 [Oscillospiraceae bacterium]|nr:hypothetical protein [Oscillospiraceae bacterium]
MKCDTRYPIILVHGFGFRDLKRINYWGRIPKALELEGASIYYGRQEALGSIEHNAEILRDNINQILAETGSEKVNIIAHSKGGLDARCMISSLGMADKVASLTTIATPHHGCKPIDVLRKQTGWFYHGAGYLLNPVARFLGDKQPDFYNAMLHFSVNVLEEFNKNNPDAPSVYYQSFAAAMKYAHSDLFLFWLYLLIWLIEGENDGLVAVKSAQWTNFRGVLRSSTNRGISHADAVDFRRMNFSGKQGGGLSDIRCFYIALVADLKKRGF